MTPRFFILVALAGVMAVVLAVQVSAPPVEDTSFVSSANRKDEANIRLVQKLLRQRELAGEEPPEDPELAIQVEVDPSDNKNRLYYYISEAHGYYVETFWLEFWYKPTPTTRPSDSPLRVQHVYVNNYLKAHDTLAGWIELVPAEMSNINGDIGTSANWGARIEDYDRARENNPNPLPPLTVAESHG